jgi:hypothetical protein
MRWWWTCSAHHRQRSARCKNTTVAQVGSGEAAAAQEYLLQHEQRIWRMANIHLERKERQRKRGHALQFQCAWMPGRDIVV